MQFGKAVDQIIKKVAEANPCHGVENLSKYDFASTLMRVGFSPSIILKLAVAVPMTLADKDNPLIAVQMDIPMGWMESPPAFCMVTDTVSDQANARIAQGYILCMYHCHKAMANPMPEPPTMTECLQHSSGQCMGTGDAYKTSITSIPASNTTSLLDSPNQSTRMGDANKTSAASLQQLAGEVVLHPTTASLATCLGEHNYHYL
jgi:hypothetical protein